MFNREVVIFFSTVGLLVTIITIPYCIIQYVNMCIKKSREWKEMLQYCRRKEFDTERIGKNYTDILKCLIRLEEAKKNGMSL